MNGHANTHANTHANDAASTHDYDILIVGAGISGINTGYRIQENLPSATYTILEARPELGGTWSLFKYPGVRSDSNMHTFGFSFKPWDKPNPLATGESIIEYLDSTARQFGIDRHISYEHKVLRADWSSDAQRWRLEVDNTGQRKIYNAKFVIMGTGYYDYEKPLQADIPNLEAFKGQRVHPQFWPEHLDYKGKKMVIIGSGATAVTIMPAVVDTGVGQVTMLQRSPSYVMSVPQPKQPPWHARILPRWISLRIVRIEHIVIPILLYFFCRTFPTVASNFLRKEAKSHLPKDFVMDPHFKPTYKPWDQRLCLCPDADFFKCFESGRAKIVTGTVKSVVEDGILLDSGEKIDADIIVTATGLNLQFLGGIPITVDKQPVNLPERFLWRTAMISGVPNLGLMIGYVNASWTLGSDSSARLLMRLFKFMTENKYTSATPRISEKEMQNPLSPLGLTSTYMKRAAHYTPKAGNSGPWLPRDNYIKDRWAAQRANLRQGLEFESVAT
ncbi:FAD/NAD(P)-binding domain-containing protein [Lentithecium fluviatile CBS 122367]|uniref:FAD/NAD(P)-binding domain-containing protein n=1 Tax=Lentithecium fluviatile CBS 122367 TaxID=1168545 RepID=A0A6G1IGX2_9PLEO|nr:FAD/NAD(P)-binding domain-containing protein [Lentithecium fluviatile CBS 122367]